MRLSRTILLAVLLVVVAATVLPRWCAHDERRAIRIEEDRVVVTNLTGAAWSDVTVWLNDYYRVQTPSLVPDQRLDVPLNVFVSGWGQPFDRRRHAPVGVQVTARGADGRTIALTWGSGRRR